MSFAYSFFDESGKFKDHSVVSFGGIAGGSQTHNALAEQWKALLRRYGLPSLTMKQALNYRVRVSDRLPEQTSAERAEALMPFVACIKEHAEIAVLNTMDVKAFNSMPAKAKQGLGGIKNPHYVSFLMDIQLLCRFLAEEDTINIICDDDEETALPCYHLYRQVKKVRKDIGRKFASLTFADDEMFPQLQAADMLASLGRLESRKRFFGEAYDYESLFDYLNAKGSSTDVRLEMAFWDKSKISQLGDHLK